jgi:predicted dehydrogenase
MAFRLLLLGSGFVTPFHLAGWRAHGDVALVGIASRDAATARERAAAFAVPQTFADVEAALDATRPDIVDICTPAELHAEHVRLAAARGAHILCQKPLAPSLATALAIADEVRRAGIRLMVHENFRFRPWYRAAKKLLEQGAVGEPIYLRSDCRFPGTVTTAAHPERPWSLARQPYFADLHRFLLLESVIHQIDVTRFLLGEPTSVYARAKRVSRHVRGEDLVSLVLGFADMHAVVERSYASKGYDDPPAPSEEVVIEGRDGLIRIGRDGRLSVHEDRPSGRRVYEVPLDRQDAYPRSYAAAIADFLAALREGRPFETGLADNLRTLDAVFAAYRSVETGAAVSLPSEALATALASARVEDR